MEKKMYNKIKFNINPGIGILLLVVLVFGFNSMYAQKTLKIYKGDRSVTSINTSDITEMTFEEIQPLAIGDAYQGGIIFYLNESGEQGLIAAPSDQSTGIAWYNGTYTATNANGVAVGTGEANTDLIITSQGVGGYAASICKDLIIDGYDDWFLPSKEELKLMYTNLHTAGLGNFAAAYYWSSTQNSYIDGAWFHSFSTGDQHNNNKNFTNRVRAVRAF